MKKLLLSVMAVASLAFAANAVTYMNVKTDDGRVVNYDVKKVIMVDYEEDGVTVSGKEGIYTYVDLGLPSGTKWATCNVGATKPTQYGGYFAWGETEPQWHGKYIWDTYKWCNSDCSMAKYCTDSDDGTVDNKKVLDAEDDAASANWGSAWRMPTEDEIKELRDGCSWELVVGFNGSGVNGRLGTSKKNGATIFLPAAGYRFGERFEDESNFGYYWSSSLYEDFPEFAYCLYFHDGDVDWDIASRRCYGQSIRAVLR